MDFRSLFNRDGHSKKRSRAADRTVNAAPPARAAHSVSAAQQRGLHNRECGVGGKLIIPGLEFRAKQRFDEILPALQDWGQNILFLGQSNMGKSHFLKELLKETKPKNWWSSPTHLRNSIGSMVWSTSSTTAPCRSL